MHGPPKIVACGHHLRFEDTTTQRRQTWTEDKKRNVEVEEIISLLVFRKLEK